MQEYNIGEVPVLFMTWLTQTGEAATITGTPTISIFKWDHVGNSWSTIVNAANMTQRAGSTWYYEWDVSGQTANYDYMVQYSGVVDTLTTLGTEKFRVVDIKATKEDVQELMIGNTRFDFVVTGTNVTRKVTEGAVNYMDILTKADAASDWSSPLSTKRLYFWYNDAGVCIARKESD